MFGSLGPVALGLTSTAWHSTSLSCALGAEHLPGWNGSEQLHTYYADWWSEGSDLQAKEATFQWTIPPFHPSGQTEPFLLQTLMNPVPNSKWVDFREAAMTAYIGRISFLSCTSPHLMPARSVSKHQNCGCSTPCFQISKMSISTHIHTRWALMGASEF